MEAEAAESASAEQDEALHRPLPSVDMPLLRNQRRALRAKQVAVIGGAAFLITGGAAGAVYLTIGNPFEDGGDPEDASEAGFGVAAEEGDGLEELESFDDFGHEQDEVEDEPEGQPVDDATPTHAAAETRIARPFGQARGFRDALTRAGASREEVAELEEALTDVLDFRRCRPQDRMIFERDPEGHLVLFEYRGGSRTEFHRAARNPRGELVAEKVEIPVERERIALGGVVQTSLGDAIDRLGLRRSLVGVFVEVFEARVSFATDARAGDTFKVIVEEERINGSFLRYGAAHALEYVGQRSGTLRAFHYEPTADRGDYYDDTGRSIHGGWLRTPVRYDRISSRYDPRRMHPILRRIVPHNGVDYAAGTGTIVRAAADGTVTFAGERGANGNLVAIRHDGGYESFYAHLHRIERGMRRDVRVRQRQVIGYVGSTGRSTGPHLHFGLKRGGRFVDPLAEINGPGRMMPAAALPRFRARARRLTRELERIRIAGAPTTSTPAPAPEAQREPEPEEPMD